MSSDASDGKTKNVPTNADTETTQQSKNDQGRSGQATPVDRPKVSNDTYTTQRHKYTDQQHRTGLRQVDEHASWRDVYRACHVGVGVDD